MNAPPVTPWWEQPIAIPEEDFLAVRAELDLLVETFVPPLLLEDAVGVITFGLSWRLVCSLSPINAPVTRASRGRCEGVAIEIVMRSHPELLHRAGIVPAPVEPPSFVAPLLAWWNRWQPTVLTPLASAAGKLDERLGTIQRLARSVMSEVLSEDLLKGVRAGMRASRAERGRDRDADETPASVAATFWAIEPSNAKEDGCYMVGEDRRIAISPRFIRDRLGRARRKKRFVRDPAQQADGAEGAELGARKVPRVVKELTGVENEDGAFAALECVSAVQQAGDVTAALAATEVERALEDAVRELRRATRGAVEVLLLDHVRQLLDGTTTPSELARQRDLSERSFRDAWERIRRRLAAHPRLTAILRSA
ncbi:MAG TPA: hypothetical protein VFM30_11265 [Steroidobacteraceae bacterium]|nr:hypothetical protein [Steroidobacteraceae bacterium]